MSYSVWKTELVGFTEGLWVIQDVAQVEQQRNVVAHYLQREDLYGIITWFIPVGLYTGAFQQIQAYAVNYL